MYSFNVLISDVVSLRSFTFFYYFYLFHFYFPSLWTCLFSFCLSALSSPPYSQQLQDISLYSPPSPITQLYTRLPATQFSTPLTTNQCYWLFLYFQKYCTHMYSYPHIYIHLFKKYICKRCPTIYNVHFVSINLLYKQCCLEYEIFCPYKYIQGIRSKEHN